MNFSAATSPNILVAAGWGAAPAEPEEVFAHILVGESHEVVTRRALWDEAARFANFYIAHGVEAGEIVVIMLPQGRDLLAAFLGAMVAGATPTLMPLLSAKQDPAEFWRSHETLFARLGRGAIVTRRRDQAELRNNITSLGQLLLAAEDALPFPATRSETLPTTSNEIAFLQHSSGTTGLKKGVVLTHGAVLRQLESYARVLALAPSDRIVSWLPLYHDMGLIACFLLPLVRRVPVVMLDPFEWVAQPGRLFSAIERFGGTLCWQPNFAFQHLCRTVRPASAGNLSSMRAWINCSEPCRRETLENFATTFAPSGVRAAQLQICYAMAETVFAATQTRLDRAPEWLHLDQERFRTERRAYVVAADEPGIDVLSAGKPLPGLRVQIVDTEGRPLADGAIGTVAITGDFIFSGYHRGDEESLRWLRAGWYFSGDLGFMHEGQLYITGRSADLIIVHGRNFHAHELEHLVNAVPGVHAGRSVALGWFREEVGSQEVVILTEARDHEPTSATALRRAIKRRILDAAGLLVHDVRLVPSGWLVKTTSGKLSRKENLRKYLAPPVAATV